MNVVTSGDASGDLFGDRVSGAAEFRRKILQLWQTVTHRQDRFSVVDVHLRGERQVRYGGGEDIHHVQRWMTRHEVAAAHPTELAMTQIRLVKGRDVLLPF